MLGDCITIFREWRSGFNSPLVRDVPEMHEDDPKQRAGSVAITICEKMNGQKPDKRVTCHSYYGNHALVWSY